jgi:hypothetical protein
VLRPPKLAIPKFLRSRAGLIIIDRNLFLDIPTYLTPTLARSRRLLESPPTLCGFGPISLSPRQSQQPSRANKRLRSSRSYSPLQVKALEQAANSLGVTLQVDDIHTADDLQAARNPAQTQRSETRPPAAPAAAHAPLAAIRPPCHRAQK